MLKGATLAKQRWLAPANGNNDHDHCSCCWAKFAEWDAPDIQHDGYVTFYKHELGASKHWICEKCFSDLGEEMQWHLETPDE
ncbi:MAG: hypothetical protein NTW74_02250 [Acidobacteria bacterium]|nr:hypothetical protein [Acidobacteriota bacterium]